MPHHRAKGVRKPIRVAVAGLLLAACVSCGGFQSIPPSDVRAEELVGYQVRVATTDGRGFVFTVVEVTEDALVGEFQRVRLDDVATVERLEYDSGQTVGVFIALVTVLALLLGIFFSPAPG